METGSSHSKPHGERVSCMYAEIYLEDAYCNFPKPTKPVAESIVTISDEKKDDEWVSPSDFLIDIVDLKPPLTSKVTRGKTHEGILAIGNDVLEKERAKCLRRLTELLSDNDNGWSHILENEKKLVQHKVRHIYNEIFKRKSKIMADEISKFYNETLQELETHMRSELKTVLTSAHANVVSDLNEEIKIKLAEEKIILDKYLKERYTSEVNKMQKYYKILFENEIQKHNKLINQALNERNDALAAFYRQIEVENLTSTMYVMCAERKKCKVKKFILENYQTTDISEKILKVNERQKILDTYKKREVHIHQLNRDWEDKIKKVLLLFLKFISFSLKLLPEQTTFLLDLEKLVVLQMNEIQKHPKICSSILVEEDLLKNMFKFEETSPAPSVCQNDPFFVVGDLSDPTPPKYGSRETLPDDVDLPYVRVDRQFMYAKCHKYEEIKTFLESQRCKCEDGQNEYVKELIIKKKPSSPMPPSPSPSPSAGSISLDEPLLIDDINRLHHCPARRCQHWAERNTFPYLDSYLDFTEENFERVKTILGTKPNRIPKPCLIDPKKYADADLPFSVTKEPYHEVATQYSSQEDLEQIIEVGCTCYDNMPAKGLEHNATKESPSIQLNTILQKRKLSLRNLMQENPNLLKMFTDECFDFQL